MGKKKRAKLETALLLFFSPILALIWLIGRIMYVTGDKDE